MVENHPKPWFERPIFRILPWLIFGAGFVSAWLLAAETRRHDIAAARMQFGLHADDIEANLQQRMMAHAQILRGVVSLFNSSDEVDRDDFRTYVEGLRLRAHYPGVQAIGYAQIVPASDKARHRAEIRAQGFPDYDIRPPGVRDSYSPVVYVEPFDARNQRAMGFDLFTDATRLAAAMRASDQGSVAMTDKVTLQQETDQDVQAGALIFAPVYRPRAELETVQQRRAALRGWVYSAVRIRSLIEPCLNSEYPDLIPLIAIRLYSGEAQTPDALMYELHSETPSGSGSYEVVRRSEILGAVWTYRFEALPAYWAHHSVDERSRTILTSGLALTMLLAAVAEVLVRSHLQVAAALRESTAANRSLAEREALLRAIYDSSTVAILLISPAAIIKHANQRMAEIFHWGLGDLIGRNFFELLPASDRGLSRRRFGRLIRKGSAAMNIERRFVRPDASEFWGSFSGRTFHDPEGCVIGFVGVIEDITERKQVQDRIAFLAHHDALTELPNRALFSDRVEQALALAKRNATLLALIWIDLDGFKPVNDQYGHAFGDLLLRQAAARMRACKRSSDTIARIGGDEFVLLLPTVGSQTDALRVAEKIRGALKKPFTIGGRSLSVSVSLGIALYPDHGSDEIELSKNADIAMYCAKENGRDTVMMFQPGMRSSGS